MYECESLYHKWKLSTSSQPSDSTLISPTYWLTNFSKKKKGHVSIPQCKRDLWSSEADYPLRFPPSTGLDSHRLLQPQTLHLPDGHALRYLTDSEIKVILQEGKVYSIIVQVDKVYSIIVQVDKVYSIIVQVDKVYSLIRQVDKVYSLIIQVDKVYSLIVQEDKVYSLIVQADKVYSLIRQVDKKKVYFLT